MNQIQAISTACKVPDPSFQAVVHSVFQRAANLSVDERDHLLTLYIMDGIDLPQGIRLPASAEKAIQDLQPGQVLLCRDGLLRSTDSSIVIQLRGARRYDGSIIPLNESRLSEAAIAAWQAVRDFLALRQAEKQADLRIANIENEMFGSAAHLRTLTIAARSLDSGLMTASVKELVGLGSGLTPTGDDVLVGFLAGVMASASSDPSRMAWVQLLNEQVKASSRSTTDVSRSYLLLAGEGQFSSSLTHLVSVIGSGRPPDRLRQAAETAVQVGHTSGMDGVTGLLAGLAAWQAGLFLR